ncbi:hypothetical protein [Myceligenerans xiligouense]|uniref:Uncharacterized protein n=1 Tax=Myceligenerans xiligouense TaxID=253184 RepID=A0A3N4YQS2_9MICO|nr:hypothetical protein [Myceligenerans xiligouense]RPF23379.1 hypothetical protein EDD34_4064 [Myceligenerans xiligouense]
MADNIDDRPHAEQKGEILTVTNMISLAGAVLIIGLLLERFAGMDPAYAVGRVVSVPLLVTAVVVGARRGSWLSLVLPTIGLALVVSTFFIGG